VTEYGYEYCEHDTAIVSECYNDFIVLITFCKICKKELKREIIYNENRTYFDEKFED